MPPFLPDLTTAFNTSSSLSVGVESAAACTMNGVMKVGLGVVSVLLALSEFLSLNKRVKAGGLIQGIMIYLGGKKAAEPGAAAAEGGVSEPEPVELEPTAAETEAKVESITLHVKDAFRKFV